MDGASWDKLAQEHQQKMMAMSDRIGETIEANPTQRPLPQTSYETDADVGQLAPERPQDAVYREWRKRKSREQGQLTFGGLQVRDFRRRD